MSKKLPKVLEASEADALIAIFNRRYDAGLKNAVMVRLMLEAGLRVSEVCALKPGDVKMMSCKLEVRDGKGGKDRVLWISEDLRDQVGRWLERRPESEFIFPTRTGAQTDPRSARRMVKTYAGKAGIEWNVTPHTLRHTFATNLLRKTGNIRLVQKALGHSDLSTTMIYTHIVDCELESAMKAMG
jgi:site-specific recombinase XerD